DRSNPRRNRRRSWRTRGHLSAFGGGQPPGRQRAPVLAARPLLGGSARRTLDGAGALPLARLPIPVDMGAGDVRGRPLLAPGAGACAAGREKHAARIGGPGMARRGRMAGPRRPHRHGADPLARARPRIGGRLSGIGYWVLGSGVRTPNTQYPTPNTQYPTPLS